MTIWERGMTILREIICGLVLIVASIVVGLIGLAILAVDDVARRLKWR